MVERELWFVGRLMRSVTNGVEVVVVGVFVGGGGGLGVLVGRSLGGLMQSFGRLSRKTCGVLLRLIGGLGMVGARCYGYLAREMFRGRMVVRVVLARVFVLLGVLPSLVFVLVVVGVVG